MSKFDLLEEQQLPVDDPESEQEDLQNVIQDLVDDDLCDPGIVREALRQYEEDYGQDTFWLYSMARVLEIEEKPQEMLKMLDRIDPEDIDRESLHLAYARAWFGKGDFEKAKEHLNQINDRQDTENALRVINMKAFISMGLGEFQDAAERFEDLMLEYPEPQIQAACGICWYLLDKKERAKEYIDLGVAGMDDQMLSWLAGLLCALKLNEKIDFSGFFFPKRLAQAVAEFQVSDDGYHPVPMNMLEEAIEDDPVSYLPFIQEELRKNKDSHMTNYLTGVCYEKLKDEKSARKYFRKTLKLPLDPEGKHMAYDDQVSLKLISLQRLGYSEKVTESHVMKIFEECKDNPESVANVFLFCKMLGSIRLLGYVYDSFEGWDVPFFTDDKLNDMVNEGLVTLYISRGHYEAALALIETMFDDHRNEVHFLAQYARALVMTDQMPFGAQWHVDPAAAQPWQMVLELLWLMETRDCGKEETADETILLLAAGLHRMLADHDLAGKLDKWSVLTTFAFVYEQELTQLCAVLDMTDVESIVKKHQVHDKEAQKLRELVPASVVMVMTFLGMFPGAPDE